MSNKLTEPGIIIKGFKATDKNIKCRDHKFKLGEWYETDAEIKLCESGFHFCPHMSGLWSYYPADSRVFEVEAEMVLIDYEAGADLKYSAKRIRLVKEVKIGGNSNTGDWNTGDSNTGNSNTGYRNTGGWNTGDWNTGNRNTGNRNTGDWNATDRCAGLFCQNIQRVKSFDVQTKLTHAEFMDKYYALYWALDSDLRKNDAFDYAKYKTMPGWTLKKIKSLHKKHIAGRTT